MTGSGLRLLGIGLLAAHLAGLAFGQRPAPTAPTAQPTLRVTTHLVQVNVIVQDRRGQPVADLARDDFVLLEEGREQPIRLFSTEPNQPLPGVEPLPPNTFSNHLERRGGTSCDNSIPKHAGEKGFTPSILTPDF